MMNFSAPQTGLFSEEEVYYADGLLNTAGLNENNFVLAHEYSWLDNLFQTIENGELNPETHQTIEDAFPSLPDRARGPYANLVRSFNLGAAERILLLLALEVYYQPYRITERIKKLEADSKSDIKLLNYYNDIYSGNYYPTLRTAIYFNAGTDPEKWRVAERELIFNGKLINEQIIVLREPDERNRIGNKLNSLIDIAPEYANYILHGQKPRPDFGRGFPATWITTNLSWDHLVLNNVTFSEIEDIMDWVNNREKMHVRSENKINSSFPCLFYGPPGTGKSLTAKLIGKQYGKDVFRIDLSMIVSKFVGETEKNLAHLFDRAEGKDWILFFDEADSLFGKRTGISDSKDKWANLEMSYLLQRMEEYKGLCILATNLKHNLDIAMTRRFQAMIYFPFPKEEERALIWKKSLPPGFAYPENISFSKIARYELSGAGIANVIKAACVKASKRGDYTMSVEDIGRFIRIEYAKDSRTI